MKLYEFGEAPKAKADGFGRIITTFRGTETEARIAYMNTNVALVRGAPLSGQDGFFEFAVMAGSTQTSEPASIDRNMSKNMNLVVDGVDAAGLFAGDGERAPFVVFDVEKQENIAGPFATRDAAQNHRDSIILGNFPMLDVDALNAALDALDTQSLSQCG